MNTKFVLRRTVVVLAIALALGSSALSPNHSRPVAAWNAVMLPPTPMPTAAIALVIAATSGIPGAIGAPTTVPWFTRRLDHVVVFDVDVTDVTRRVRVLSVMHVTARQNALA